MNCLKTLTEVLLGLFSVLILWLDGLVCYNTKKNPHTPQKKQKQKQKPKHAQ